MGLIGKQIFNSLSSYVLYCAKEGGGTGGFSLREAF